MLNEKQSSTCFASVTANYDIQICTKIYLNFYIELNSYLHAIYTNSIKVGYLETKSTKP